MEYTLKTIAQNNASPYFTFDYIRRKEDALTALYEWLDKLDKKEDAWLFGIVQSKIQQLLYRLKLEVKLSDPKN